MITGGPCQCPHWTGLEPLRADLLAFGAVRASELVAAAVDRLHRSYVFPDRVPAMEEALTTRLAAGAYEGLSGAALCAAVSEDAQAAGADRHLRVDWVDEADEVDWSDPAAQAGYWRQAALDNYGVYRVERLPGNVGYLDLRALDEAEGTAGAFTAAMAVLSHTSALLLDLSQNRGGASTGMAYVCSYFFPPEPVHLSDLHGRDHVQQQYWTWSYLPGARYLRPVWVLVGGATFSAAEEVAYNLQQLGRATVVGAVTRGGANHSDEFDLGEHVRMQVSVAYPVNAVSGTNWDGRGVAPDVPAEDAYPVAYRAALEAVLAELGDDPPAHARELRTEAAAALAGLSVGSPTETERPGTVAR
jgi:hypothetical protein